MGIPFCDEHRQAVDLLANKSVYGSTTSTSMRVACPFFYFLYFRIPTVYVLPYTRYV